MATTNLSGPLILGSFPLSSSGDSNSVSGPSIAKHGWGLLDDRYAVGGGTGLSPCLYGADQIMVMDFAPSTLSAVNIVPAAAPVAATPMTLAAASTGITVVPTGGFQLLPTMNVIPAGSLMIDGNPATIQLGQTGNGGVVMYDPRTMSCRCLTATSVGNDTGGFLTVKGYDFYGQPMTSLITLGNMTTPSTTKAFKAVTSVTPSGTLSGSNVSLGTADVYGFGLAAWEWASTYIVWNNIVSTITGFTAAVSTTATSGTGDVRGTYAIQTTASNGTRKLQMFVSAQSWNLLQAGLWGVTQF